MKAPKDKSQAKSMVMIPLYRSRVERNDKAYKRREKHKGREAL